MAAPVALRLVVAGRVQGVGFRPFVWREATARGLTGWVKNVGGRVEIHAEGAAAALAGLQTALIDSAPPLARPKLALCEPTQPQGAAGFIILPSDATARLDVHLPPDLFCCDDCLAEMRDPKARRYRYAFTNCTQCGPRYTIISGLPYDRAATAMADFAMCPDCARQYADPQDRRFHAEPLACPVCGPRLRYAPGGAEGDRALADAVALLASGGILAVKGVGGYHLICDAANDAAVLRLRQRKHRPDKPLAVMLPLQGADGCDALRRHTRADAAELAALRDAVRPIVLVTKADPFALSPLLAPGLAEIGVFLPYAPLHALLLSELDRPLVATSGNISGEPVLTDPDEAARRLAGVADGFLHHDRPILRPADDSVLRQIAGAMRPVRLGRGLAPVELSLPRRFAEPVLAFGGQMKATVALGFADRAVMSPHIGDLDSLAAQQVQARVAGDLQSLYGQPARAVVCDLHPDYASTRQAIASGLPVIRVQHHRAHASALAAEHPEGQDWLIFVWDGTGLGDDGTLWGGEAFHGRPGAWQRVASFRPFGVTGGDRVGREPWRSAAALMWQAGQPWFPPCDTLGLVSQARERGVATVETSAVGRLFDAGASLILGRDLASFEGQGPMELEAIAGPSQAAMPLPLVKSDGLLRADWQPLLALCQAGLPVPLRAAAFHDTLAATLAAQAATLITGGPGFAAIGLTGGVFQNRRLTEAALHALAPLGLPVHLPRQTPANDGGLAFGQLVEALFRQGDPA